VLTVGTASATAPSLVVTNDRFVLAWSEGDAQSSVVRVASTTGDFASLAARAVTVSPQFRPRKERRTHGAARWSDRGVVAYE
jgi:hypothetical protein